MASRKFHFFTDANTQASNGSAYLNVQGATGTYGPVASSTAGHDEYRVTSLHTATGFDPTAYAACDGMICVQRVDATRVNIILKPLVQPPLNFAPVKYIIYKGILASSLIDGTDVAPATSNQLAKVIHETQAKKNASLGGQALTAPKEALGIGLAAPDPGFLDTDPIDNLFFRTAVAFQPPTVNGGWSIGRFDRTGFGIEILMEGLGFHHPLSLARQIESRISVPELAAGANDAQVFEHWHDKEQVLGFMDPCAFYGSFFRVGVAAKTSTAATFTDKPGAALYRDVLFPFANRNLAYLDIRNEHNFSFNYFRNYGTTIRLSTKTAPVDYYASGWPILTLTAADLAAGNTTRARNAVGLQLPVGDNPKPLIYVSQGYRDINRKGAEFPAELKSSEQFFDAFDVPAGGYTVSKRSSGASLLSLAIPNVAGQGATTPVSCYLRLKYLKQELSPTPGPTSPTQANYLDSLFWPLDLVIPLDSGSSIRSVVFHEDIYVNAQVEPDLQFDGVAQVGFARDAFNVSLFILPTNIRSQEGQATNLVSLTGETADGFPSYPTLVASKYANERVRRIDLALSLTDLPPTAKFVSDVDEFEETDFTAPDFSKLLMIVVAKDTFDSWLSKSAAFAGGFRTYLGVTDMQTQTDTQGIRYTSFKLVLRGLALDLTTNSYSFQEANTDPDDLVSNIEVYAYAGT